MSSTDKDLPQEVEDIHVTVPDIFAGISTTVADLEDDIRRLNEIQEMVEQITPAEIDQVQQVAERVQAFRGDIIEADSLDEIESIYEKLKQAIDSPHIQQAKTSYRAICDELGLTVDDETDEEIITAYEETEGDDIEAKATTLSTLQSTIAQFRSETQSKLAIDIDGSEKTYFQLPIDELQPLVSDYESREDALEAIATKAEQADAWASPLTSLPEEEHAYDDLTADIDAETVIKYIEQIDLASVADDLPVTDVVTTQLRDEIESNGGTSLTSVLNTALETSFDDKYLDHVAALLAHDAVETDGREASLNDAYLSVTAGDQTTIQELHEDLDAFNEAFEAWAQNMVAHIQAAARIHQEITSDQTDPDTFDCNSDPVSLDPGIEKAAVMEHPVEILELAVGFDEWLSTQGTEGGEGVDVNLLQKLVRGESVSAQEINGTTVEELSGMLGEDLQLTYRQRDNE